MMSIHQYLLLQGLEGSKKENINIPLDMYDSHFNRHELPIIRQRVVGTSVVVTVNRQRAVYLIRIRNRFIKEGSSIGNF